MGSTASPVSCDSINRRAEVSWAKPGQYSSVQHGTSVDCEHSNNKCNYMMLLSAALVLHMTNVNSYFDVLVSF